MSRKGGASAGGGTSSLLVTLGISLLAEAAVVGPRALSTGLPFATGRQDSGSGHSGRFRPPSPAGGFPIMTPPLRPSAGSQPGSRSEPIPSRSGRSPDDTQPWRSPSVSDGINWLRQQTGQPQQNGWSQQASSASAPGYGRSSHHDHHHRQHGRTSPS